MGWDGRATGHCRCFLIPRQQAALCCGPLLSHHGDSAWHDSQANVACAHTAYQVGTNTIAIVAKAANKPVYVAAESYKFARMYPLRQDDVPNPEMAEKLACGQEVRHWISPPVACDTERQMQQEPWRPRGAGLIEGATKQSRACSLVHHTIVRISPPHADWFVDVVSGPLEASHGGAELAWRAQPGFADSRFHPAPVFNAALHRFGGLDAVRGVG